MTGQGLCLVTGATGFIGRHLVPELHRRGYRVRCLVRPTSNLAPFAGLPIEIAYGDLSAGRGLEEAVAGADYLFHLGGLIRAWRAGDYEEVNTEGTRRLLDACVAADGQLRRFVLVSSLAAAGPSLDGTPITEEHPAAPTSAYGRSKRAGELAALAYAGRVPLTVVRPPVVYGPGDRVTLPLFRLGNLGLCPSLGGLRLSLVYVDDLVGGLILAAGAEAAAGRTYFMAGEELATAGDVMRMIAASLGRRSIPVRVPYRVAWSAGCLFEACSAVLHRPVLFDRAKAGDMYRHAWCCDSGRARQELGFTQGLPLAESLGETARWYRDQGWLWPSRGRPTRTPLPSP